MASALTWNKLTKKAKSLRRVGRTEHGYLGDGNGNVEVTDRPGYRIVRIEKAGSLTVGVYRGSVRAVEGTPVILNTDPITSELVIAGIDRDAVTLGDNEDLVLELEKHAASHGWTVNANDRLDNLNHNQFYYMRVQPGDAAQTVDILPGFYFARGQLIWKDTTDTLDLSASYPVSGAVWVMLTINEAKVYSVSSGVSHPSGLDEIPAGSLALYAIRLTAGADFDLLTDFVSLWQCNQFDSSVLGGGSVIIDDNAIVLDINGYPLESGQWVGLVSVTLDALPFTGVKAAWDSDVAFFGLIDNGADRKDTIIVFGDNADDEFRIASRVHPSQTLSDVFTMTQAGDITLADGATIDGINIPAWSEFVETYLPSPNEKAALVGRPNPPSGSNPYSTQVGAEVAPANWGADGALVVLEEIDRVHWVTAPATIVEVSMYLETTGSASSTICDIDKSTDGGLTWNSIFDAGDRPEIAWDDSDQVGSSAIFLDTAVEIGDLLRANIAQVATGARNLNVYLKFKGSSVPVWDALLVLGVG